MDVSSPAQGSNQTMKSLGPKQSTSGKNCELGFEHVQSEDTNTRIEESNPIDTECLELPPKDAIKHVQSGYKDTRIEEPNSIDTKCLDLPPKDATKNFSRVLLKENRVSAKSSKRKYILRSSVASVRVLRSRSRGTPQAPGPSNSSSSANAVREEKRKRKKQVKRTLNNEFTRTRKRLQYLLHRMSYEQSLIDAYSGEGWKGQSLDKIKPEKELQRAASEILSCKRKIRDLFQHIDSLCAEGRLLESLFDSEGQIDSEDILCAKCGSKELSTDNDIILCDGTCSRGFHQMCLEPPLLKEDIPPGDEGWLCPGCDCKVDCVDLLNDVRGTDLSIFDNWEKIFPEAASVAAAGDKQDDNFGYPSDDSEDNDYDPDGPEVDEKVRAEGSSSEESDFTSASDDSEPSLHDEPYLGLPSDDSEDTDYDPNVLDHDEQVKQESSSSDFTSDSEDFSARIDDNRSPGTDEVPVSSSLDSANPISQPGERRPKITGKKKQSVNSELLSILEADPSQENAMPVSGKRHKERLDYKRLHDDAYGNVSSESSDDEDWTDNYAPRKRNDFGKDVVISPQGNSQPITNGANTKDMKWDLEEAENTLKRRTRQKLDFGGTNNSEAKTHKDSPDPGSIAKKSTTSASKSLGEAVTQRLRNSFRENVYPTRDTKENLANELGITFRQVSKWFENARRSSRQSASVGATEAGISSPNKAIVLTPTNRKIVKSETKIIAKNIDCNGAEDKESGKAVSEQAGVTECCSEDREERKSEDAERRKQQSTAPTSRKQKGMIDDQTSDGTLTPKETPTKGTQTDSRKAQTAQKSCQNAKQELTLSRVQTRNRKSVA